MNCSRCESDLMMFSRRTIKGGAVQYVYQCQMCGKPSHPVSHQKAMEIAGGRSVAEFNPYIEQEYYDRLNQKSEQESAQRKAEFHAWYAEYLKSDDWRQRRELVMRRAHGICEGCGIAQATEVHHMSYEHVGEEFLWELVAICSPCHERYHGQGLTGEDFL